MRHQKYAILAITVFACFCMALVDAVIQPGYWIKSAVKMTLFLLLPIGYSRFVGKCDLKKLFCPDQKGILAALSMGIAVFAVILGAFFALRNWVDFSALTVSLSETAGVNAENFLFVSSYIALVNSLLEEFFFRGFAFLTLRRFASRSLSYTASAALFALYHVAMMIGWFPLPVTLLAILGLFCGGILFNYFNERHGHLYFSWLIHMFANFAINAVGFILFHG